jgi:DNA mismatch repair protein MLH1
VDLTSVLELRQSLISQQHDSVTEAFHEHTFVGLFNTHLALMQHGTRLLIVNFQEISGDLMFQRAVFGFANFGVVRIEPASIEALVVMALEERPDWNEDENDPKDVIAERIKSLLVEKSVMLQEYFSLYITPSGELCGIPNLLDGCLPEFVKLPEFLLELGASVDYSDEKECFEGICVALAKMFAFDLNLESDTIWKDKVEHFLFPALRSCIGLEEWLSRDLIVPAANLSDLYKIFERC